LWSYPLYFARTCYCKFCRFTDDIMILAISFSIFYTVANGLSLSLSLSHELDMEFFCCSCDCSNRSTPGMV
jgi:hypothetical protein